MARQKDPPTLDTETARVRNIYEQLAPRYNRMIAIWERLLFADARQWACRQATGDVLEVAIGTGRNLPWYSRDVTLTGIDLSPAMLNAARFKAKTLDRGVVLQVADAQQLPFDSATFDTAVATLTLCSIPDEALAVAEMARVLRPGGQLILVDHVASPAPAVRGVQRVLDPLSVHFQGDHLLREPHVAVREAGLVIDEMTRSKWGIVTRLRAHKQGATA